MSKVKSPQAKKRDSLLKDRRNTYGECPTSSRKNISKGKQRSHQALRRAVGEVLRSVRGASTQLDVDVVDQAAKQRVVSKRRASFKKHPDEPLAVVIHRKSDKRTSQRNGENRFVPYAEWVERLHAEGVMLRHIKKAAKKRK